MEQKTVKNGISTKDNEIVDLAQSVVLSKKDAEEYRSYKRRKKLGEITSAISLSGASLISGQEVQKVCERAVKFKQSFVKTYVTKLSQAKYYLTGSKVKMDCVIGGAGETLAKVKAYEARLAIRRGAGFITLVIAPSFLDSCRYGEIRKEIKRVKRATKKAVLKVRVDSVLAFAVLSRVARIACELGVAYFSVPYFLGCERLKMDMSRGCNLEVTGVDKTEDFKRLVEAGATSIVTDKASEIYAEWLQSAEEESRLAFVENAVRSEPIKDVSDATVKESMKAEPILTNSSNEGMANDGEFEPVRPLTGNPETDYCCRLVGNELQFL